MPDVHPTAVIEGDVELHDDVQVGPACVLTGPIRIGAGCRLIGNAYLQGPLRLGAGNVVYPFACLGFAPQHVKFDPDRDGPGLEIGDGNTFREHVTVHRAFLEEAPTIVGDRNYLMVCCHVGHDCHLGSDCVLVNGAALGGHVQLEDRVTVGGGTVIHQHCRIGRGAMLSGGMATSVDVPPYFMLTGVNICGAINLVGLRRGGMSRRDIDEVRWAYRTLYREGRALRAVLDILRQREDSPIAAMYADFIESSSRGICTDRPTGVRGIGDPLHLLAGEGVASSDP